MNPAADVAAVPVQRDLQPVEKVRDEEGNHLLGELIRAVVVAAAGYAHIEPVGPRVGPGHEVAAGLGGGIGRVRLQRRVFRPRAPRHASVDLVGGDLDHFADLRIQAGLQQDLDAGDVGGNEI